MLGQMLVEFSPKATTQTELGPVLYNNRPIATGFAFDFFDKGKIHDCRTMYPDEPG
jgi:hypothetical protein